MITLIIFRILFSAVIGYLIHIFFNFIIEIVFSSISFIVMSKTENNKKNLNMNTNLFHKSIAIGVLTFFGILIGLFIF